MKGPLYVTSFLPVSLIFVAIIGSIALGEKLTLGRLLYDLGSCYFYFLCVLLQKFYDFSVFFSALGSVMIITGLYFVLWGKRKETIMTQSDSITAGEDTSENASSAAAVQEV